MNKVEPIDLLIVGGGPVGMTLALAMRDSSWRTLLIDKRPWAAQAEDPRALALSHGTRQLLQGLGVWPEKAATVIDTIHVSQRGGFGRVLMTAREHNLPALGYVTRYKHLSARLQSAAARLPRLQCRDETLLERLEPHAEGILATMTQKGETRRYQARLVVHAEGAPDNATHNAPEIQVTDYQQHAIICDVTPDHPHNNRAWERFTPDGPLALLPLEQGFSVVFTAPPARVDALMALSDADFLRALSRQFGSRFGFSATGQRHRFPLALRQRRQLVQGREVWIGNAAQTLHPVSGQGFNLGLRDAWQLAEHLQDNYATLDAALAAHAASRQLDRRGGAAFTDKVVRLFSNDAPSLRFLRGLGLLGLDIYSPAKNFIARRMIWGARAWI
jgi:2-octaprenyl-6-methoxyphenol hydroxylase